MTNAASTLGTVRPRGGLFDILLAIYLPLSAIYLFPSGTPQLADGVMLLVFVATAWRLRGRLPPELVPAAAALAAFVYYVCLVNTAWLGLHMDFEGRAHLIPAYYIYNALVFVALVSLALSYGARLLKTIVYAASLAVLALAASTFTGEVAFRDTLTFNDPNQLGLYALTCGTIMAMGASWLRIPMAFQAATHLAVIWLIVVSLSRSASFGALTLLLVMTVHQLVVRRSFRFLLVVLAGASTIAIVAATTELGTWAVDRVETRFHQTDYASQMRDDRGYGRVWEHPQHLLVGAGEGGEHRFGAVTEIHSTPIGILFCYGLVGFALMARFLARIGRGNGWATAAYLLPILVYSLGTLAHRNTIFWVALAFICSVNLMLRRSHPLQAQHRTARSSHEPESAQDAESRDHD